MSEIPGAINGLYYCNINEDEILNKRIAERNIPSHNLQPQFSPRPVSTKYAYLPITDRRAPNKVPINTTETYNVKEVFNPGTAMAPWDGFAANIDVNSVLKNQFFALQKCDQSTYVPSSDSDMYKVNVEGRYEEQPFPGLFKREKFNKFDPNTCDLGNATFNNPTRIQLKQMCNKEDIYDKKICKS